MEQDFCPLSFVSLSENHFPLLLKWLETSHVKQWLDANTTYTQNSIRKKYETYVAGYKKVEEVYKPIHAYIINIGKVPIGYIQIYKVQDFEDEISCHFSSTTGMIDMFIGETNYLKKGWGTKALLNFLKFNKQNYTNFLVYVNSNNFNAIQLYKRVGFKKYPLKIKFNKHNSLYIY